MTRTQYLRSRERLFWPSWRGTYRRGMATEQTPAQTSEPEPAAPGKPRMARDERMDRLAVAALMGALFGGLRDRHRKT